MQRSKIFPIDSKQGENSQRALGYHAPSFYPVLLNHGLQRVPTTHHPLLPQQSYSWPMFVSKPKEALVRGQLPWYSQVRRVPPLGGEQRVIKVLIMKEALSRWSQTHIGLYFRGKKHLLFEIQVLNQSCHSTEVFVTQHRCFATAQSLMRERCT